MAAIVAPTLARGVEHAGQASGEIPRFSCKWGTKLDDYEDRVDGGNTDVGLGGRKLPHSCKIVHSLMLMTRGDTRIRKNTGTVQRFAAEGESQSRRYGVYLRRKPREETMSTKMIK